MKSTLTPFRDCFAAIHGSVPAHFKALHECFEEFEVDNVVFDDEDINGRDGTFEKAGGKL